MSLQIEPGRIPQWDVFDRFRKARESCGLTQTELAERTGISRRTISAIETGDKKPGVKELNLWQMATGVPRAWLETGEAPRDGGAPGGGSLPGLDSNQEPIG